MSRSRLVYVLIGATLAIGLLVSAYVPSEPRLTASADCYGPCRSMTALSLSRPAVTYGHEHVEKFRVNVSTGANGIGRPAGSVVVESKAKVLCRIRLHLGRGSCSPAAKALAPGSYKVVANYRGNKNFKHSKSSPRTFTVRRH
jgi:hypothetical protein